MILRIYWRHIWRYIFGWYWATQSEIKKIPSGESLHLDLSARQVTFTFTGAGVGVRVKGVSHYQSASWKHVTNHYEFIRREGELPREIEEIALRAKRTCEMGLPILLNQRDLDALYGDF